MFGGDNRSLPEEVEEYIGTLQERIKPQAIVLFGSRSGENPHPQSDYDIMVIAEDLPKDFWERQDSLWEGRPLCVEVIGLTPDEVASKIFRGLILDALLQGVVLRGDISELKGKAEAYLREYRLVRMPVGYVRRTA